MEQSLGQLVFYNLKLFIDANGLKTRPSAKFRNGQPVDQWLLFLFTLRLQTEYKEKIELNGYMIDDQDRPLSKSINVGDIQLEDAFTEDSRQNAVLNSNRAKILNINLFSGIKDIKWHDVRLSRKGASDLLRITDRHTFLNDFVLILRGVFENTQRLYLGKICFNDAYVKEGRNVNLTSFAIIPRRIPLVKEDFERQKQSIKLIGFKFIQFIQFYAIDKYKKMTMADRIRLEITTKYKGDNDCYDCFMPDYVLCHLPKEKRYRAAFEKYDSLVDLKYEKTYDQQLCLPKNFQPQILNEDFAEKYTHQDGRWVYKDEFLHIEDKFKRADEKLVDAVQDDKGAAQLLRLIKSIPQLKYNLTIEQEKMISTPNNLLCLGRSGTGKTTSSALRLFSTDAFFKFMEDKIKFRKNNPDGAQYLVNPEFMNNQSSLKLVFVTASPVLTNEVRKFYQEMKSHFISELKKRRAQQQLRKEEMKEGQDFEEISIDQSVSDISTQEEQKDIDAYIQMEGDILADDEEIEKQLQLPPTMETLSSDHFPLFVTVKRLIYMLDSSLDFSFFSRNVEGNIVGMEKNVEWHNESKGVFMINNYFKQQKDYDDKIRKLGKKLIQLDEKFEAEEENLRQEFGDDEEEEVSDFTDTYNVSGSLGSMIHNQGNAIRFNLISRQLSFEVDFEIFKNRFWPKVANWTKLSPLVVWTEIFSVIKGGADCVKYEYCNLPLYIYAEDTSKRQQSAQFLSMHEKYQIYQIFMNYEKWKANMNAYDFNDVVNHIIRQLRFGMKPCQMIHFLMVDEVQDLTPNLLRLLTSITDRNVFFCGDTAQTIAKGVGFRFFDLKKVFQTSNSFRVPSVLQLSKNFRSHSKILDLANSVVSLLELFFPKTIDKLLKESSDLDGPKPIFIDPATPDQLRQLLFKRTFANLTQSEVSIQVEGSAMSKPQFGCNQVVIVRDQESKLRLPEFLTNMLCLTVYEAKGLEFDDVILYNFFEDSKCGSQWMLIRDVDFIMKKVKKYKDFDFIQFDNLDIDEEQIDKISKDESDKIMTTIVNDDEEIRTKLILKRQRAEVYRSFAQLCTELKFLYVAITRPKKVLVIYDTDSKYRKPIQEMWNKMSIIEVVTKDMLIDHSLLKVEVSNVFKKDLGSDSKTSLEEWRFSGIMLFKKKFYSSAIQCFKNAGDKDLELRCLAYQHADRASSLLGESESKTLQSKNKSFSRTERNEMKREAKELKKEAHKDLDIAGGYFNKIGMQRHAAQCYCTAQMLHKAAQMFESLVDYGQSAECYLKTGDIRKAAEFYAKAGLFANAFECYERMQDWEGLLMCLSKNKDFFKKDERESLIEKYFPIALNSLYELYSNFNPMAANIGMDEENKGKMQELRIKLKFQKSISIIKEENDESFEEEEEEEEVEEIQEEQVEESKVESVPEDSSQLKMSKEQSSEFEIIDTSIKVSEKKKKKEDLRKFVIDEVPDEEKEPQLDSQVEIIQEEQKDDQDLDEEDQGEQKIKKDDGIKDSSRQSLSFEILSHVDPEDEFLKSERSSSLIQSIISQDDQFSIISGGHTSEFSIVQDSKLHSIIKSVYSGMSDDRELQLQKAISKKSDGSLDLNSQISEISCQSGPQLINTSRFSTISNERDEYAEDIVMQKIIFYISLFSEEVKNRLREMRSKESLGYIQVEESEFDSDFMIMDLDNISKELLYLILDTLEHYEMFRLCIIICNRYHIKEKVGRYLVSIGNKYSNIKNYKFNFMEKFNKEHLLNAQQKYSLIAHEAMHNVLAMVEKDLLKIDDKGNDSIGMRELCFDSLFLQGFWKKLVFFMDIDSSLQLTYAVNDRENFLLLYLVYRCGVKDGLLIKRLMEPRSEEIYSYLEKDVNKLSKLLAQELLMHQEISDFGSSMRFAYKLDHPLMEQSLKAIRDVRYLLSNNSKKGINKNSKVPSVLKRMTGYIFKMVSLNFSQRKVLQSYLKTFHFEELNDIYRLFQTLLKIVLNKKQNDNISKSKTNEVKRMAYHQFGVTFLQGLEVFDKFSESYCLVSMDSILIKAIEERQEQEFIKFRNSEAQRLVIDNRRQYPADPVLFNVVNYQVEEIIKNAGENQKFNQKQLALLCDLQVKFCLAPIQWVEEIVLTRCLNYSELLIASMKGKWGNYIQQAQLLGLTNNLSINLNEHGRLILKRQTHEQQKQLYFAKIAKTPLIQSLFKNIKVDMVSQRINQTAADNSQSLKGLKSSIISSATHILSVTQNVQRLPSFDYHKYDFFEKSVLLNAAFSSVKQAFDQIGKNEKFYSLMLKCFRLFALSDDYIYLLQILRNQKKMINRNTKLAPAQKKIRLANISNSYILLDIHVYLKCNLWNSAIDQIYAFLNSTFNFISYWEISQLIDSAFFRALFNFYIYRRPEKVGVFLPNYAMCHIDPAYMISGGDSHVDVQVIEFHKVYIDMAKDIKMISEAFYWAVHLLTVLNKDEEGYNYKAIYVKIHNMINTFLLNITPKELQQNIPLAERVMQLFKLFRESSVEKTYRHLYHIDTIEKVLQMNDQFHQRKTKDIHSLLKINKDFSECENPMFLRLIMTDLYDKELSKQLQTHLDKAYYVEQGILARHIAASNFISRIKNSQLKEKHEIKAPTMHYEDEEIFHKQREIKQVLSQVPDLDIKLKDQTIIHVCQILNDYDNFISQLIHMQSTNLIINSLDLHFMKHKFEIVCAQKQELIKQIKELLNQVDQQLSDSVLEVEKEEVKEDIKHKKQPKKQKYVPKYKAKGSASDKESIFAQLSFKLEEHHQYIENQRLLVKNWLSEKAEPNLVEIEKKKLNMQLKWENLIQFNRRKKIMLKHLSKKKK